MPNLPENLPDKPKTVRDFHIAGNIADNNPPEEPKILPPSGGWGDAEHATEAHKNIPKDVEAPPSYDPKWRRYRENG